MQTESNVKKRDRRKDNQTDREGEKKNKTYRERGDGVKERKHNRNEDGER